MLSEVFSYSISLKEKNVASLVWLDWLSVVLCSERLPIWFPVRSHMWFRVRFPDWRQLIGVSLSHQCLPPSLPYSSLSKHVLEWGLKERKKERKCGLQFPKLILPPTNSSQQSLKTYVQSTEIAPFKFCLKLWLKYVTNSFKSQMIFTQKRN